MMQKTHEQFTVSFIFLGQQLTRNLPSHSKELLHPLYFNLSRNFFVGNSSH